MYLYTVNAFPYGAFKGTIVKEQVYEPDWRSEERTQYTMNVADVLADVAPETSRRRSRARRSASSRASPATTWSRATPSTSCASPRTSSTSKRAPAAPCTLALEPEPFCFLETTDETVDYFTNHLYSGAAAEMLATLAAFPISEAIGALRRHLGIVFDICHQAVEYEDIADVAAEARRRRHPDLQAAGGRRDARARGRRRRPSIRSSATPRPST